MNEEIYSYAMTHISKKRIDHTMGVIKSVEELTNDLKLDIDLDKAKTAALLHDITKYFTNEEHINLCIKYNCLDMLNLNIPKTFHAITGYLVAKNVLKIEDNDILDAILYHTTGREKMSLYEQVVFIADFIEIGRKYEGVEEIRKSAKNGLKDVLITGLSYTIESLAHDKKEIHINTFKAYNYYITKKIN